MLLTLSIVPCSDSYRNHLLRFAVLLIMLELMLSSLCTVGIKAIYVANSSTNLRGHLLIDV